MKREKLKEIGYGILAGANILVLIGLFLFPFEFADAVESAKQTAQELISLGAHSIARRNAPQSDIASHLWNSVWNGRVVSDPSFKPSPYDYQYDELERFFVDRALVAEEVRRSQFDFDDAGANDLASLQSAARRQLEDAAGMFPHSNVINELSVTQVPYEGNYSVFRVKFKDAFGLSIEGLLAKPASCRNNCPVLIAPNGYSSSPEALVGIAPEDYQHQFGKVFANSGYVVFAVFIPAAPGDFTKSRIAEQNGSLLARLSGTRYWAYWWVDKVMSATDFVETLGYVDTKRIAIYGISMGGQAALYSAAIDSRIDALVVSGTNVLTPRLHMLLGIDRFIYPQDYFWDISQVPDTVELLFSLYPKPTCVELGRYDVTGDFELAYRSAQRVQAVYQKQGAAQNYRIAIHEMKTTSDGHEMEIVQCKSFLDEVFHLEERDLGR